MLLNLKNTTIDRRRRHHFQKNEIFFECCALLNQAQFSNSLDYYFFKRKKRFFFITQFRNRCLFSNYNRSVLSQFKMSRHVFLRKALSGSMPGFYKAIW